MNTDKNMVSDALRRLEDDLAMPIDPSVRDRIMQHLKLVREWNRVGSLVSKRDSRSLETHTVDSLSLVPAIHESLHGDSWVLDIGSGAGFPIVPVKCVLNDLQATLLERSSRKVGFLRKVTAALGLSRVTIVRGSFPEERPPGSPSVITARAVENPRVVFKRVIEALSDGGVFLCQSGDPRPFLPVGFEAEEVLDRWRKEGLRRGVLYRVFRTSACNGEGSE